MIVYKTGDWWRALWHFHMSAVILRLLRRVALVGVYNIAVVLIVLRYHVVSVQLGREYFSFLGIMLITACCWCF